MNTSQKMIDKRVDFMLQNYYLWAHLPPSAWCQFSEQQLPCAYALKLAGLYSETTNLYDINVGKLVSRAQKILNN